MMSSRLFFQRRLSNVEVVWKGTIHQVYFCTPQVTEIMEAELPTFVTDISTGTNQEKLEQFVRRAKTCVQAVPFRQWLDTTEIPIVGRFLPEGPSLFDQLRNENRLEWVSWRCSRERMDNAAQLGAQERTRVSDFRTRWTETLHLV